MLRVTVADLIAALQGMPQEAEVAVRAVVGFDDVHDVTLRPMRRYSSEILEGDEIVRVVIE